MSSEDLKEFDIKIRLRQIRREGAELLKGNEPEEHLKPKEQLELKEFEAIGEKYDKMRVREEQLYRAEYTDRVKLERLDLIDKAGSKTMKPAPPTFAFGDIFNKNDHWQQAKLNVRSQHNQTMGRLDAQELKESKTFLEKSSQRKEFKKEWDEKAERRRSETRRQSPERRRSPSQTMSD